MTLIALIGPPAAGKGTITKLIQKDFSSFLNHISIGDLLRAHQHPTSIYPQEHMAQGILANDQHVLQLLQYHIKYVVKDDAIIDGFPRTMLQAQAIHDGLIPIKLVINVHVDRNILLERMSNRLIHKSSGRTYHRINCPPRVHMRDDITGDLLHVRSDDHHEAFERRLADYHSSLENIRDCLGDSLFWSTPSFFSSAEVYAHVIRPKLSAFLNRQ